MHIHNPLRITKSDNPKKIGPKSLLFVSPAKHGPHIGIIIAASSRRHTFGFRSITFEGMHQFHSKFTKG